MTEIVAGILGIINLVGGFLFRYVFREIRSLRAAELACRERESNLRERCNILESRVEHAEQMSVVAHVTSDSNGIITEWDNGAVTIFAYTRDEAVGKQVNIIIPMRMRSAHHQAFTQAVKENRGPGNAVSLRESYATTKAGIEIPVIIILNGWEYQDKRFYSADIRRRW